MSLLSQADLKVNPDSVVVAVNPGNNPGVTNLTKVVDDPVIDLVSIRARRVRVGPRHIVFVREEGGGGIQTVSVEDVNSVFSFSIGFG